MVTLGSSTPPPDATAAVVRVAVAATDTPGFVTFHKVTTQARAVVLNVTRHRTGGRWLHHGVPV